MKISFQITRIAIVCAACIACTLVLSSCFDMGKNSNAVSEGADSTASSAQIMAAFDTSFHAFAKMNCLPCHGDGGQEPEHFASASLTTAYAAANTPLYVNFINPQTSLFVTRAGDGHCGVSSCSNNSAAALSAIQAWAKVALAGGAATQTTGQFILEPMEIPASLPTGSTFKAMRWAMNSMSPASSLVNGAIFELEIQQLNSGEYKIQNPKIAGLATPIQVTGIHVYIKPSSQSGNGSEDPNAQYWDNDVVIVNASTLPTPLPSTPLQPPIPVLDSNAMIITALSSQDSLAIGFDAIMASSGIVSSFSQISAQILQPSCVSCHQPGNAGSGFDFTSYSGTARAVTPNKPASSQLYNAVSGSSPDMPQNGIPLTETQREMISSWISSGALNN